MSAVDKYQNARLKLVTQQAKISKAKAQIMESKNQILKSKKRKANKWQQKYGEGGKGFV